MTTTIEYALMAGASYISTRPDPNKFPVPDGWNEMLHDQKDSGFEAVYFQSQCSNEIVISYAGTYDKDFSGDLLADAGLALGFGSAQLLQAAEYYVQVKMANPGADITFAGHSLGGGLASLMGVFFNQKAVTFDQAPFMNSATKSIAMDVMADLLSKYPPGSNLQITGILKPLVDFIATTNLLTDSLAARSSNVAGLNTQGEFLSVAPLTIFDKIGAQAQISHGQTDVSGTDLHAQSLLTAMLQSGDTQTSTAADHTLGQVTYKLRDLLKMFFDKNLFAHDTDTADQNLLDRLVQHQAGGINSVPKDGDAMVTRFTADLWKLAQDGGLTLSDGVDVRGTNIDYLHNVSKALTAFAMQMYYEDTDNAKDKNKQLFTDLSKAGEGSNGIRFDMADVSTKFKTAFDKNEKLDLNDAKGYQYFDEYLNHRSGSGLTIYMSNVRPDPDCDPDCTLTHLVRDGDEFIAAGTGAANDSIYIERKTA